MGKAGSMGRVIELAVAPRPSTQLCPDAAEQTLFRQIFVPTSVTLPLQIGPVLCRVEGLACSWSPLSRCYLLFDF